MKKIMDKMQELQMVPGLYDFVIKNCYLAGGAVRDLNRDVKPKDYDIYFLTADAIEEFGNRFGRNGMDVTALGNFNYNDFQFITVTHGLPKDVVGKFDWNVNMQYYLFGEKSSHAMEYVNTIGKPELRFNLKSQYPLSAFIRLPYLIEKGYYISPKELIFVTSYLVTKGILNSPEEAQKQVSVSPSTDMSMYNIAGAVERAQKIALSESPLMNMLKEPQEEESASDLL